MFESKLNIYTIQKSALRKVFRLFTEKVLKIGNIKGQNTNLKLYFAFVNDQTQMKYKLSTLLTISYLTEMKYYAI